MFSNSYSDCLAEDADVLRSQAGNEFQHSSANRLYLDSFFSKSRSFVAVLCELGLVIFLRITGEGSRAR